MIHYHGTPFSGEFAVQQALKARHAMVSWSTPGPVAQIAEICQTFTLDNGAYSAWTQGETYDIEGYAEWVGQWYRHPGFDWCVMPDVIDSDENANTAIRGKWRNLVMDYPGLWEASVPVWHLHESMDYLAQMVHSYPRIALGSSGQYADPGSTGWWNRIAEAMAVICDDGIPKCKLHGLRMLDPRIFSELPFASADSTNVARNIGLDKRWTGPYVPESQMVRALVIMDRIEAHGSATRWNGHGWQQSMKLFG